MKERLQVHQHRMIPAGQNILIVKIAGVAGVEQRHLASDPEIEAFHGGSRFTGTIRCEFAPAMGTAIENLQGAKGRLKIAPVTPVEQFLVVNIHGKRMRLIDELKPRLK